MNDDLPVDERQREHRKPKRPSWAWAAGISAATCTLAAVARPVSTPRQGFLLAPDSWFPPDDSGFGDIGDGLFSYRQLVSLPAGAAQLRAAITRAQAALQRRETHGLTMQVSPGAGVSTIQISGSSKESTAQVRASNELYTISQLLSTPVTPAVRAALYRAAAGLRGVRYDGGTHDPLGRPGVAVSVPGGVRMVFNPATGTLLSLSSDLYLTQVVLAQGIAASVYSLPAGVQPLRAKLPAPQIVSIQPHAGTPSTVFWVQLPATRRPRRLRTAPTALANLDGPTGSNCRSYLLPPPFVTLRGGAVSIVHGTASYRYRLAPASIARDAWCRGRYQLQLMGPGQTQTSLYFEIG